MSWSVSQSGSAHKKQLWTHRLVWLFLHIDRPQVWHRGWICTAPGVPDIHSDIDIHESSKKYIEYWQPETTGTKPLWLTDSRGSSCWREGEWWCEMEFLCEWGEMMSVSYRLMAAQEIVFLGLLVKWLQFRRHTENELKAALVDDSEWVIFLMGGALRGLSSSPLKIKYQQTGKLRCNS